MPSIQLFPTSFSVLLIAYLLGSLPTALLVSRAVAGVDIREIGDGNMGARNVTHTLGWGPGVFVATVDFCKGSVAVLIARYYDLDPFWQLAAGTSAVLGHDFPLWVGFRGGQGMAAILGALFVLLPLQTGWGLIAFSSAYLLTRNFDLSAAFGLGSLAILVWNDRQPPVLQAYTILLFLSIPAKKVLDWPRRRRLKLARAAHPITGGPEFMKVPEWDDEKPVANEGSNSI
jgi:acyl phosphate:glycerol-3-phosphate acyltransferase